MKTITLPVYSIVVKFDVRSKSGMITSDISSKLRDHDLVNNRAVYGIESIILAHACAGLDIESEPYIEGIKTAVNTLLNYRPDEC